MNQLEKVKNKKILVTGSSGFLGRHLCIRLADLGGEVLGIDSVMPISTNSRNISGTLSFVKSDITNKSSLHETLANERFDLIYHLAAIASPRTCKSNFDLAYEVNVIGTKNIISISRESRLVFMSSASVYGNPIKIPITEDHPLNGSDPYSITKITGEYLCRNYIDNYGYNISIARNFNSFGIRQTTEYIVPTLVTQALNNGKITVWNSDPVRDLMYVDDTIDALVTIGINARNEAYNIGSGKGITMGDLAECIRDNIDPTIEIEDLRKEVIGSRQLISNNAKLKELGWQQKVTFDSGISQTITWFKNVCYQKN